MPLVLTYFNGRGVIEVARYMLHIGGADWEDFRYPIDMQSKAKYEHAAADKVGFVRKSSDGRIQGNLAATAEKKEIVVSSDETTISLFCPF